MRCGQVTSASDGCGRLVLSGGRTSETVGVRVLSFAWGENTEWSVCRDKKYWNVLLMSVKFDVKLI